MKLFFEFIKDLFSDIREWIVENKVIFLSIIAAIIFIAIILIVGISFAVSASNALKANSSTTSFVVDGFAPYGGPSHPDWKELVQIYDCNWNLREEYISYGEVNYSYGVITIYVKNGPIWIKAENIKIIPIREGK